MSLQELYVLPTEEDVFCARFSPGAFSAPGAEQQLLALGHANGTISILGAASGALHHVIAPHDFSAHPTAPPSPGAPAPRPPTLPSTGGLPVTALRWRPEGAAAGAPFRVSESTTAARNVLLAAGSDGTLRHIHATSGRVLGAIQEPGAQIYAIDYRGDARAFASAGNAKCVNVYDEETRALTVRMAGGSSVPGYTAAQYAAAGGGGPAAPGEGAGTGHSSRVFGLAWHPLEGEGSILASGGWDNTVQVWDTR